MRVSIWAYLVSIDRGFLIFEDPQCPWLIKKKIVDDDFSHVGAYKSMRIGVGFVIAM